MRDRHDNEMISYQFRYVGEPYYRYERLNAYESGYIYYAEVEFVHPITKKTNTRIISSVGAEVTNLDVIKYIDGIVEEENYFKTRATETAKMNGLIDNFKKNKHLGEDTLIVLVDLLLKYRQMAV